MAFDYDKAPANEIFEDIKANAIKLWKTYDNEFGYVTEKVSRIKHLQNIKDNAWYMVAMFDIHNQVKLITMVKPETAEMIMEALKG